MRGNTLMARTYYLQLAVIGVLLYLGFHATILMSGRGTPPSDDEDGRIDSDVLLSRKPSQDSVVPRVGDPSRIYEKYAIHEDKCRIRNYDHDDPEILKKYFSNEPTKCPNDARPFVFHPRMNIDKGRSCIGIDHAIAKESYDDRVDKWKCTFKEVVRDQTKDVIDNNIHFGKRKAFKAGDCPTEEFIWIECERPESGRAYQQPLMLPLVKSVRTPIRPNNIGRKPFHVLVLGLDTISRLNAYRQLPQTLEFLQSKRNFVELFGYNKIEVKTRPNQVPLLTGIPFARPGLESRVSHQYYDNLTRFVWDHYEEHGYRTMFFEEHYSWGLFVADETRSKGFQRVPTTYWPRPIMQAIEDSSLREEGLGLCIGPDLPTKHYLDYTFNTMKILGNERPLFTYGWMVDSSHEDMNGGQRDDKNFLEFFKKMDSSGILNHTAVFFISDHGPRYGDFRNTPLGRYEDMLPYGSVLMPDSFYESNPAALKNLRINSRRLVTVYDFYTTLLELADPWGEGRVVRTANGHSLFSSTIPSERDCEAAGIKIPYCSCFEAHSQDKAGAQALSLAKAAVDELNHIHRRFAIESLCQEWILDNITDFVRLSNGDDWTNYYKVNIHAKPSARFEVTGQLLQADKSWLVFPDIDRTDEFSPTSLCVSLESYAKFCHCK